MEFGLVIIKTNKIMEKQYKVGEEISRDGKTWQVISTQNVYKDIQSVVVQLKTKNGLGKTIASFFNDRSVKWNKKRL